MKKRLKLWGVATSLIAVLCTLIAFNIVLPIVFQANIFTILVTWAPYSMAGGFLLLIGDTLYLICLFMQFAKILKNQKKWRK